MARCGRAHALPQELLLVLHHSDISTTAVCKLLCVSKGVQAAVMILMAGQLPVKLASDLAFPPVSGLVHSFAAFVRKYGSLIKKMEIDLQNNRGLQTVAAAMQDAALRPPGLQIQSFSSCTPAAQLLHQLLLFRTHLTKLDLRWFELHSAEVSDDRELVLPSLETTQLILAGLPNLSNLSLSLCGMNLPRATASDLWRSLSALTAVTQLRILEVTNPQDLSHLPTQLKELYVTYIDRKEAGNPYDGIGVDLTHLTALTMFRMWPDTDPYHVHIVTAADRFPISLRRMELRDVLSVQPLLQLTRLQQLHVLGCEQPPDKVAQLSKLTSLTSLDLVYYVYHQEWEPLPEGLCAAASADDCPASQRAPFNTFSQAVTSVPLRRLTLTFNNITPHVILTPGWVCFLGKLTGLTLLELFADRVTASHQHLATSLSQLPHLQVLSLLFDSVMFKHHLKSDQLPGTAGCTSELLRVIAGRSQLQSLRLDLPDISAEELQLLGGAVHLTSLALCGCRLTDTTTAVFLPSLPTGLKKLNLCGNRQVGDATLELIGQRLQHLTMLCLNHAKGVTDRGLEHLTSLWQLKALDIYGTQATEAAKTALLAH